MVLPNSRFGFYTRKKKSKKALWAAGIVFVLGAVFLTLALTGVFRSSGEENSGLPPVPEETLASLWEKLNYEELNRRCEEILSRNPLDIEALSYNGFAYFYRGVGQFSMEERLNLINLSIANLRKALIHEPNPLTGSLQFILGKAYYLKGRYYYDLAIKYLELSLASGYQGDDTYEYLGLSYTALDMPEKSAQYYLRALENASGAAGDGRHSDTLYLSLAQAYLQLDKNAEAEDCLNQVMDLTQDQGVEEKSRFLLGRIYTGRGDIAGAETQYRLILEKNASAADAHYYLGEIYETQGDGARARYEWRKAVEIDPYHYGARLKLYG
ncbi:MAG: tetratricopeptide repeat protein [Spirochaetales bacterium]|jgi:tetratricopeptide (TPR) repeat protein|nr:tetratricopeptide repeat protein [Spirochaetales bacterium]